MKLFVGLGNPGPQYARTRHNAGFVLLDLLVKEAGLSFTLDGRFKSFLVKGTYLDQEVLFLKPLTFMNRSGQPVGAVCRYFKIPEEDVLVFYDDIDVPAGKVKSRVGGGHGGHNGVRSLIEEASLSKFHRIKLGFGRPPGGWDPADWLLAPMSDEEGEVLCTAMLADVKVRLKQILSSS